MKILAELPPADTIEKPAKLEIAFPGGIIGFPKHVRGEVFNLPEQLPFQWLRLHGPTVLHFVVIDPTGILPDYAPELFDDDANAIGLTCAEDAFILNIVTVRENNEACVNLVGPIIINRHTGAARQVVISNHSVYSAHHALVSNP